MAALPEQGSESVVGARAQEDSHQRVAASVTGLRPVLPVLAIPGEALLPSGPAIRQNEPRVRSTGFSLAFCMVPAFTQVYPHVTLSPFT